MTATPATVDNPERLFLELLPAIDRILEIIARKNALPPADADEFSAWARTRLTDKDYAILRKFAGRSTIQTYLSVVLSNLFRDYRNSVWGRWRPSAAALRLGPLGVRLEELISRDGCSLREAIGAMRNADVTLADREIAQMAARLPMRRADQLVSIDGLSNTLPANPDSAHLSDEEREQVGQALLAAIDTLPQEDQVLTRMRFWDNLSIADIARVLRLDQKPLYRRIESIQGRLKSFLALRGVTEDRARDILSEESIW